LKRAAKKFFTEMLAGGEEKNFAVVPYRNCTFLTKCLKKTWKFPNKKGTFDVNLATSSAGLSKK
jgi:hypothetical protein